MIKKPSLSKCTMRNSPTCSAFCGLAVLGLFLTVGCRKAQTGKQRQQEVLHASGLVEEVLYTQAIGAALPGIGRIAQATMGRHLQLAANYAPADTSAILVIPCFSTGQQLASTAYSNVPERYILLNPRAIEAYLKATGLDVTTDEKAVVSLMLMHELGHFKLRKVGAFDFMSPSGASSSVLGEQKDDLTPINMTTQKRLELAVDSTAVALLKLPAVNTDPISFSTKVDVQLVLPKLAYWLTGLRVIGNFGLPTISVLRDPSPSHPNMELRATFMSYYFSPTPTGRQLIDDYLYAREVEPLNRQAQDPRIFQEREKVLSQ